MSATMESRSELSWRVDVRILTEPLYLAGYAKAIVIAAAMMGTLLSFLALVGDNADSIGAMWMITAIAVAAIVVMGGLGTALLTGNRMALAYAVNDEGIVQTMVSRKLRAVSGLAIAAGALTGNPGAAGAGLLARSQNRIPVGWPDVVSARFYPARRAVALRNSWRTVLIVFCTSETYDTFLARVNTHLAGRAATTRTRRNPLFGFLVRTLVAFLGCLPFFVLPWPFELDLFVPLLTLCFALAAVWLIPYFVLITAGGLVWMWIDIAGRATLERQSSLDGSVYTFLDRMNLDDAMPLVIAAAGTLVLLVLGVGLVLGRFPSALASEADESDEQSPPPADGDPD